MSCVRTSGGYVDRLGPLLPSLRHEVVLMALVWKCDRCRRTSDAGNIDDPPDNWRQVTRPIRGSGGARSTLEATLCDECDDAFYDWFNGG